MPKLRCDMRRDCEAPITHIDRDGYIYCTPHAIQRRAGHYGVPCRKLTGPELVKLGKGEKVTRY